MYCIIFVFNGLAEIKLDDPFCPSTQGRVILYPSFRSRPLYTMPLYLPGGFNNFLHCLNQSHRKIPGMGNVYGHGVEERYRYDGMGGNVVPCFKFQFTIAT